MVAPLNALPAVTGALQTMYREVAENGSAEGYFARYPARPGGPDLMRILGIEGWLELERDFGNGRTTLPGSKPPPPQAP